jgi:PAS domain S-box-containing protein
MASDAKSPRGGRESQSPEVRPGSQPRPASGREPVPTDRLLRLLIDSVRDYAIFLLDTTGHIRTWNPGAQRFKGYTAEEAIGRHFSMFYPPSDIISGKPEMELRVAAAEGRFEDEGWRVKKDGGVFWANVIITALRDESGELVGFGKVTRDLSERRRAEEALRESEEKFRLLVHNVVDYGIMMLDAEGRVASWNEGARRVTGWTENEILGCDFAVFYPSEDRKLGRPENELRVAAGEGHYAEEGWRIRKDGTRFWASVMVTPLRDAQGVLMGFAKVTRDLTERRAAEERAIADALRLAEAESASRAKSDFLAALSHELRTPLNAIGGYADILSHGIRGPVTDQQLEDLNRIKRSQQHLLGIINDLLNFTRIEAGRLNYDIVAMSLADTVDAVRPLIEPLAANKKIRLIWHDAEQRVRVFGDVLKVEQILVNLMTNAVKYTEQGGSVEISYERRKERGALTVKDTGIGIPKERLDDIFEPFVQVGRSLTTDQEGTGLGLAISRDLAQAMGGDLEVKSEVGVGSEFTLLLPAVVAAH